MTSRSRSFVAGLGLVAVGASAALIATNVEVSWQKRANATPMSNVAVAAPPVVLQPSPPQPEPAGVSQAKQLSRAFAAVAAQVSPSVVRISVAKTPKLVKQRNPFRGSPFEDFFDGQGGGENFQQRAPKQRGTGSGVVIDTRGYILTNNHVVDDADEVVVNFLDGKSVPGKVVGTDPKSDLAVVKVDGVAVKAAKFGDSEKLDVGEWVMAIGNPLGLDHTVTVGVVSAKNRYGFQQGQYEDFVQTDASINPGNSGGPLVDLDGNIIGINTMIAGVGTGIGFAVPSAMAKPISEQLISGGKVRRAYLGILMQDVTPELAKTLGTSAPMRGAMVNKIESGSPADKAGLKTGDVIVDIDNNPVDGSKAVQRNVLGKKVGDKVSIGVYRDGAQTRLTANAGELPGEAGSARADAAGGSAPSTIKGHRDLTLQTLTPPIAERLGMDKRVHGAVITGVRDDSPASEAGVQAGDIVVEVDRKPVAGAEDANRLLGTARPNGHLLRLQRGDAALYLALPN